MPKILVVDDDEMLNKTIRNILKDASYETVFAFNGFQAISFAKEKPDLILLDIIMPGKKGDDVYSELKSLTTTYNTPIIIISGAPPDEIINLANRKKIKKEDIFIKPFNFNKLLERISYHLVDKV